MPRVFVALVLTACTLPSPALTLGDCMTESQARARLAAEGQTVIAPAAGTASRMNVWLTANSRQEGYVLRKEASGAYCVQARVPKPGVSAAQNRNELCGKAAANAQVVALCRRLKQTGMEPRRTVTVELPASALASKLDGRVVASFAICVDPTGREVMCGRGETALSQRR